MDKTDVATTILALRDRVDVARQVYVIRDYGIFKTLEGNRNVIEVRKQKIKKSIDKVGYIPSPIICNNKLEVIDRQGRLAVLREKELPVEFIIIPGIGLNECISMNVSGTQWTFHVAVAGGESMEAVESVKRKQGWQCAGPGRKLTSPEGVPRKQRQLRASDSEWDLIRAFAALVKEDFTAAEELMAASR